MNFDIEKQETYSRGQLLLRSFFGFIYIMIPHMIVSIFYSIALMIISIMKFFAILIFGKFPKEMHTSIVKVMRYNLRLNARLYNLRDGYPPFGLDEEDEGIIYDMPYVETISRGRLLFRAIVGPFMLIPHVFVVVIRIYAMMFISIYTFFMVLFTKKFPDGAFKFSVETLRWNYRMNNYLTFYTDDYPPFHGRVLESENKNMGNGSTEADHLIA